MKQICLSIFLPHPSLFSPFFLFLHKTMQVYGYQQEVSVTTYINRLFSQDPTGGSNDTSAQTLYFMGLGQWKLLSLSCQQAGGFTDRAQILLHQPLFNTVCMEVMSAVQCRNIIPFSIFLLRKDSRSSAELRKSRENVTTMLSYNGKFLYLLECHFHDHMLTQKQEFRNRTCLTNTAWFWIWPRFHRDRLIYSLFH